jgi:hypothetical protein
MFKSTRIGKVIRREKNKLNDREKDLMKLFLIPFLFITMNACASNAWLVGTYKAVIDHKTFQFSIKQTANNNYVTYDVFTYLDGQQIDAQIKEEKSPFVEMTQSEIKAAFPATALEKNTIRCAANLGIALCHTEKNFELEMKGYTLAQEQRIKAEIVKFKKGYFGLGIHGLHFSLEKIESPPTN